MFTQRNVFESQKYPLFRPSAAKEARMHDFIQGGNNGEHADNKAVDVTSNAINKN